MDYTFEFNCNSSFALFENGTNSIKKRVKQKEEFDNPYLQNKKKTGNYIIDNVYYICSENATLNIDNKWDGKDIKINLKITDNAENNMMGQSGFPNDIKPYSIDWTIKKATDCPKTIVKLTGADDDTWVTGLSSYSYLCYTKKNTYFPSLIINEELSETLPCKDLINLDDLNDDWKLKNNIGTDLIKALNLIFNVTPRKGSSFSLDDDSVFFDDHDGFPIIPNYKDAVKEDAYINNRLGFKILQTYKCGDTDLCTTEICRRLLIKSEIIDGKIQQIGYPQIMKKHNF
jgi:hypothetical protein